MALGMLPVLISGGIDVSVSSTIALCAVISGKLLTVSGANLCRAGRFGCGGSGCRTRERTYYFEVENIPDCRHAWHNVYRSRAVLYWTNGGMDHSICRRISKFWYDNRRWNPDSGHNFAALIAITALVLKYTPVGRGVYAIGGSASSAVRVGYNVNKIQTLIYVFTGMTVGLAAVVHTSIVQQVDPNTFTDWKWM